MAEYNQTQRLGKVYKPITRESSGHWLKATAVNVYRNAPVSGKPKKFDGWRR
jgi:hypothetical protein